MWLFHAHAAVCQYRFKIQNSYEKSHYSGKAGRHTAKVQYTVNTNGLIIHNTRHSPGRVHDVRVYRMKHPTSVVGNVLPDKFQVVRIPRGKY